MRRINHTLIALTLILTFSVSYLPQASYANPLERDSMEKAILRLFVVSAPEGAPVPYFHLKLNLTGLTFEGVTNVSGHLDYRLQENITVGSLSLRGLIVYGDYIVVGIQKLGIENVMHKAVWIKGETRYFGLDVAPEVLAYDTNTTIYRFTFTVARAKPVNVSCADPFSSYDKPVKLRLNLEPSALPSEVSYSQSEYEELYFVPINYPIRISFTGILGGRIRSYTTIVKIRETDTLINWMKIYSLDLLCDQINQITERVEWYSNVGLDLYNERRDVEYIKFYQKYLDNLFDKRKYREAMYSVAIVQSRLTDLRNRLDTQDKMVTLSVLLALAFSYGFSALILFLTVKEERLRLPLHIAIFFLLTFIFFYTLSEFRVGFTVFTSSLIGVRISYLDLPSSIVSCFFMGTAAFILFYFLIYIASLKIELPLNLAMRNLQSRFKRTLPVAITIAIVVGGSLSFIRITGMHGVVEAERKPIVGGVKEDFMALYSDIYERRFIAEDAVAWFAMQEWVLNVSYCMTNVDLVFERGASSVAGVIYGGKSWAPMKVYAIDPEAYAKLYGLNTYIFGSYLSSNESTALLPSTLGIPIGESIQVSLLLIVASSEENPEGLIPIPLGKVKVKGTFNPNAIANIKMPDGKPMFENPGGTVIIPMNSLPSIVAGTKVFYIPWLYVTMKDGSSNDRSELARRIVHLFGCDVCIPLDGYMITYKEVDMVRIVGLSSASVPMIIVCMIVYLTMYYAIYERRMEIKILTFFGGTPKSIMNILLAEGLILGLFSSFLGYFGTYIINLILDPILGLLSSILGFHEQIPFTKLESTSWGFYGIALSILIGTFIPLMATFLSAFKARNISLLSRESRRSVEMDIKVIGNEGEFSLPIRSTMFERELLYAYFDELFSMKFKPLKASGRLLQDGSFEFRYSMLLEDRPVECRLLGVRRDETIYPSVRFPADYKDSRILDEFLYKLEKLSLGYTTWKDSKLKVKIIRAAPVKKEESPEDVLAEVRAIRENVKLLRSKLEKLESMRPKISSSTYEEYHGRYTKMMDDFMKKLRPLALKLEPYYDILLDEVKRISSELEKFDVARSLGELDEEAYQEKVSSLEERLKDINMKIIELDNIFKELRLPKGMRMLSGRHRESM